MADFVSISELVKQFAKEHGFTLDSEGGKLNMSEQINGGVGTPEAFSWNDSITGEQVAAKKLLTEGVYEFTVIDVKKGEYFGSEKLPRCLKAEVHLSVGEGESNCKLRTNLYLHKTQEWKLSSFFESVGLKQKGQRFTMDWEAAIGKRGSAKVVIKTINNGGSPTEYNSIDSFVGTGVEDNSRDDLPF